MPQKPYLRKTNGSCKWSEEGITLAIKTVQQQIYSIKKAARQYSTLCDTLKKQIPYWAINIWKDVLSEKQKTELAILNAD